MFRDPNNAIGQVVRLGSATELAVNSASAASSTFSSTMIRLCATTDCRIKIGSNPTAAATDAYLKAGVPEYFQVVPGVDVVAVIRETADGKLSITEVG